MTAFMTRTHSIIFSLILSTISLSANAQQLTTKAPKIKTIIIDAGHGGTEPGAKGTYSTEAQITLQLALRLDTLLRNELPDVRFVMTRTTDIFHNPREKANIANRENGDLFLCIHVNAMPPKKEVIGHKTIAVTKKIKGKKKKVYQKVPI